MLWVYRTADGVFLRDQGTEPVLDGQATVDVPRVPDMERDRYGDPATPIRRATPEEIAAADGVAFDAAALDQVRGNRVLRAVAMVLYGRILRRLPTDDELLQLFDDVKTTFKALDA